MVIEEHTSPGSSAPLPALIAQFYQRYPAGSLTAELIQIHDAQFIVRASVQINGEVRATGMAAATTIEAAEDQARLRAITLLATALPPLVAETSLPGIGLKPNGSAAIADTPLPDPLSSPPDWLEPDTSTGRALACTSSISPSSSEQPELPLAANSSLDRAAELSLTSPPKPKQKSSLGRSSGNQLPAQGQNVLASKSTSSPEPKASGPIDLSDVIAQTTTEMKRLGWSEQQGRDYLQATFGKRSRQHLTDEELLAFCNYLAAQP